MADFNMKFCGTPVPEYSGELLCDQTKAYPLEFASSVVKQAAAKAYNTSDVEIISVQAKTFTNGSLNLATGFSASIMTPGFIATAKVDGNKTVVFHMNADGSKVREKKAPRPYSTPAI